MLEGCSMVCTIAGISCSIWSEIPISVASLGINRQITWSRAISTMSSCSRWSACSSTLLTISPRLAFAMQCVHASVIEFTQTCTSCDQVHGVSAVYRNRDLPDMHMYDMPERLKPLQVGPTWAGPTMPLSICF